MQSTSLQVAHSTYYQRLKDEDQQKKLQVEERERQIRDDESKRLATLETDVAKPYQATKAPKYDAKTAAREHRDKDGSPHGSSGSGIIDTHFDNFLLGSILLMVFLVFGGNKSDSSGLLRAAAGGGM